MQATKAKQLLKARLLREKQIYEMRKRAELKAAISELERPWEAAPEISAPTLFSLGADEQLKVLADRFQRPGGFDMWSPRDGPQVFRRPFDGLPSARFFPKGAVHSVMPYGGSQDDADNDDDDDDEDEDDDDIDNYDDDVDDSLKLDDWAGRGRDGPAGRHRGGRREAMNSAKMIGGAAGRTGSRRRGIRSSDMISGGAAGEGSDRNSNGYGRKMNFHASNYGRGGGGGTAASVVGRKKFPGGDGPARGQTGEKKNGYGQNNDGRRRAGESTEGYRQKNEGSDGNSAISRGGLFKSGYKAVNLRSGDGAERRQLSLEGSTASRKRHSLDGSTASPRHGRALNWDEEDYGSDVDLSWVL